LGEELLAQAMIIFYGKEAVYHYGASTPLARKYPGAYLIQWAAIKEAKRRGCERYNFWGVAPEDQKDHRFAKLSVFKRGFGGKDFAYLRAHDLIIDKMRYKINVMIEKQRKKRRKV
jgi:lipid II:glycine glycyltransferase (peptidoglycan interpeptide bridge formation enzyme)